VTLALLHASGLAVVAMALALWAFGRDLARIPSGVPPGLALLSGAFLGFAALELWLASERAPRARLTRGARFGVAAAGAVVGVFGLALLVEGPRLFRP